MLLAEKLAENRALIGHAFNFSNELESSVLEVAYQILGLMNSSLELDIRGEATHEIARQCLSASKAHRMLDWKPLFDLEMGLKRTLAWYNDFFKI
jgi:CDP-glucose 4,6-dehydratase